MSVRRAGSVELMRAAALCALVNACGDPGSVQVPFPPAGLGTTTDAPSPKAVVVAEGTGADSRCDALQITLPSEDARNTLRNGIGERQGRDDNTIVECTVRESSELPGSFDMYLGLRQSSLVKFELRGSASGIQASALELALPLGNGNRALLAYFTCSAQVRQLLPGAVWLSSLDCASAHNTAIKGDCSVMGGVIFEYCDR